MQVDKKNISSIVLACAFIYSLGMASSIAYYGTIDGSIFKYFLVLAGLLSIGYLFLRICSGSMPKHYVLLVFLILSMIFSVIFQILFLENLKESEELGRYAHSNLLNITLIAIVWLLVGFATGLGSSYKGSNLISIVTMVVLFVFVIPLMDESFVIDYREIDEGLSHLTAGDGFYILIIAAVASSKGKAYWLVLASSVVLLFMLTGRANLAIFVLAIAFYEFFTSNNVRKLLFLLVLPFAMLLALVIISVLTEKIADDGLASKMLFSYGLENDGSFNARYEQLINGIHSLKSSLLFGDASDLIRVSGSMGAYIHNILSWIQFYGLLSFFVLISVMALAFNKLAIDVKSLKQTGKDDNPSVVFRVLLLISGLVGVVIAKFALYTVLMFALGIYISSKNIKQV